MMTNGQMLTAGVHANSKPMLMSGVSSTLTGRASIPKHQTTIFISRAWTAAEFQLVGVVFGITLGFGYFVICHATRQARKLNIFTVLVWLGICANLTSACLTFLFASGVVNASVPFYICTIHLWAIQLNCVFQIMVSRIILVWSSPVHRKVLRWGIWLWSFFLTAAVFTIWIPARLHVSPKFIAIDAVWYRVMRLLCLLTNACLNMTFICAVKKTLVANGLTKYNKVLRFNAKILGLSLVLDLVPILLLIFQSSLLYISFFPLSTMVKLETELVTNDLIVDVINSEQQLRIIRDSHFAASPGNPSTFDGIETPRTCVFSDEEGTGKSSKIKKLRSSLNLLDMWKLPQINTTLDSVGGPTTGTLQVDQAGVPGGGMFFHVDDKLNSSSQFGTFFPFPTAASPSDIESEDWTHSRFSSGHSIETDLTVELWHRGF